MVVIELQFLEPRDMNTSDLQGLKDGRLDLKGPSIGVLIWSLLRRIEDLEKSLSTDKDKIK